MMAKIDDEGSRNEGVITEEGYFFSIDEYKSKERSKRDTKL